MSQLVEFYKESEENKGSDINKKILAMKSHYNNTIYLGSNDETVSALLFTEELVEMLKKMEVQTLPEFEQIIEEPFFEEEYVKTISITIEAQSFSVDVVHEQMIISNMGAHTGWWIDFNQMTPKEQEQISA